MRVAAIILLLAVMSGCGMDYHLRRANYHLRLAQAKGAIIKTDTIYKTVSYTVPTKVYDTVVVHDRNTDTLFITNTKYSVKLKYDTITHNQYVRVECKGDTVFIKVPVSVPITIEDPKRISKEWIFIGIFFLLLLIAFIYQSLRSKK